MKVFVEIKSGRDWVKRGTLATMGKHGHSSTPLSDAVFDSLMLARHSPIEEYEVWVDAIVPERVHTHVVRHKELGKYVATSRPDISYMRELEDGMRLISLKFNLKRLIEICMLRKCFRSWGDTVKLFNGIAKQMGEIDPLIAKFLVPSCVHYGHCVETHPDNKCMYFSTEQAKRERKELITIGRGVINV